MMFIKLFMLKMSVFEVNFRYYARNNLFLMFYASYYAIDNFRYDFRSFFRVYKSNKYNIL